MGVSSDILSTSTWLRLGERVVARCDDGALVTEYALFDAREIVLHAADPVLVRETGYMTTARDAMSRLAKAGATPKLALEAASALSPEVAASFARTGGVRALCASGQLGPCELFDGGVYSSSAKSYAGMWLDLGELGRSLGMASAASALQALHLVAVLEEVSGTTAVFMSTANATRGGRPGQRTHRRVTFSSMRSLPRLLGRLPLVRLPEVVSGEEERRRTEALLTRVRERGRADVGPGVRARLARFEATLSMGSPPNSRLSDAELWSVEQELASGRTDGVFEALDRIELLHGPTSETRYLRARAALLRGDEAPATVAEAFSALAEDDRHFHEAELGAARAWLAAGEEERARVHARRLADDGGAAESVRMIALEILDATARSARPGEAPTGREASSPSGQRERQPRTESGARAAGPASPVPGATDRGMGAGDRNAPPGASLPPMASITPAPEQRPRPRIRAAARYEPELVEGLALPLGAVEEALPVGQWPTTAVQARTAMTRLARSVGRDYRLWYGATLRCNVLAVDAMQRHLMQRYSGAPLTDPKVEGELHRHGALLSEIIARALGADWVDVATTEPGYWAMLVPPGTRCWPIGRVYRFLSLGHRERDLVSFYLDLEARARES
ncbi:MAG: hypothetical protein ABTD50_13080 [Polyangiaceae bacterium]